MDLKGDQRILTSISENLGNDGVRRQIVEHVALINTNRGNNISSRVNSNISHLTGVGGEACDFASVLKHLDRASRRGNNRLITGPCATSHRAICLQSLQDILLGNGVDTNHAIGAANQG
jgi:hypothetical protein